MLLPFYRKDQYAKDQKKKGFKNQCFNAWHTEWNSSSDKLVVWLVLAVLPKLLKLLKKLASKSYQKPLNTETLPEYA